MFDTLDVKGFLPESLCESSSLLFIGVTLKTTCNRVNNNFKRYDSVGSLITR